MTSVDETCSICTAHCLINRNYRYIFCTFQPQDDEERLKESIVQLFVKQLVDVSDRETTDHILNPNMDEVIKDFYNQIIMLT